MIGGPAQPTLSSGCREDKSALFIDASASSSQRNLIIWALLADVKMKCLLPGLHVVGEGVWGQLLPSCQQTIINPPLLQSIPDVTFSGLCGSVTFPYFVPNKDGSSGAGPAVSPLIQRVLNQREPSRQQAAPGVSSSGLWPPAALATAAAHSCGCDVMLLSRAFLTLS